MLCTHKTKNGTCGAHAKKGGKYCAFHLKKAQANVTHGRYARPETLGVPAQYEGIYQEYLNSERPFDLRKQYAFINALYHEMRDTATLKAEARTEACTNGVVADLRAALHKADPAQLEKLSTFIRDSMDRNMHMSFPLTGRLNMDDLETLTQVLERISRVASTMKKIVEGVELKVSIDFDMLLRYVQHVILPILPTQELRSQAAIRTRAFSIGRFRPEEVAQLDGLVIESPDTGQQLPVVVTASVAGRSESGLSAIAADFTAGEYDEADSDPGDGPD